MGWWWWQVVECLRCLGVSVVDMRLIRDPHTRASRGVAYVHCTDTEVGGREGRRAAGPQPDYARG